MSIQNATDGCFLYKKFSQILQLKVILAEIVRVEAVKIVTCNRGKE